ncbi:hypothetical protein [Priestia taiwanensis]|uniref:Uncharacterized protein n=1 Tax=Priestia taiwanensis TaxID=1347902 RepID=A0A917ARC6_9BACI|nr:hypothetical protein [Priestia taiwanensis]MBM7363900.1 hypothetical protein [Priestia taiwanensis]GGE69946.1 hypothetical protein GCM10007140_19930 [Priestia taiwanensis]
MSEVGSIGKKERESLLNWKRIFLALAIGVITICVLVSLSYTDKKKHKEESLLAMDEQELLKTEEELRNHQGDEQSKVEIENRLAQVKLRYERHLQLAQGDWKSIIQEEIKAAEEILKDQDIDVYMRAEVGKKLKEHQYYIEKDVRPFFELPGQTRSASREFISLYSVLGTLVLPGLVIFLVTSNVVGRMKTAIGTWCMNSSIVFIFSLLFYAIVWLLLSVIYGFSLGVFEARWLDIETTIVLDVSGDSGHIQRLARQNIDYAYLVPSWLFILYMIGLSTFGMIVVATIAFLCRTLSKAIGAGLAFIVLLIGEAISRSVEESTWLFSYHLNIWPGEMVPPMITSIVVLSIWLIAALIPSLFVYAKRDVSHR